MVADTAVPDPERVFCFLKIICAELCQEIVDNSRACAHLSCLGPGFCCAGVGCSESWEVPSGCRSHPHNTARLRVELETKLCQV